MGTAVLNRDELWQRMYACWMGKNAGGTLGAPLEGQPGPHDFEWYPELREGGIPNDDLEMQLIWFEAVKRSGWRVEACILAQAWLTHIGYNFCEYGIAKRNLRWGLLPPLSGAYDNDFFNDCMGSPIRSEIWACLAPASPRLAVRFAFEDAIVDHAGGEGVWGEMFFAALESAAFVKRDLDELLDLALSYIPPECQIQQAIRDTRQWWRELGDWRKVRERIVEKYWHREMTHAPQNLAFTVLGLLASDGDFGKAITTAVNCGQDTDCTGATSGAIMGLLLGELPPKWIEPLGETIATNLEWGGIRHFTPPADVRAFTDEVVEAAERLLAWYEVPVRISESLPTDFSALPADWLYPDEGIRELWERNRYPWRAEWELNALQVGVDYHGAPTVNPEAPKPITLWLRHREPIPLSVDLVWNSPTDWQVQPIRSSVTLPPRTEVGVTAYLQAPARLLQTQTLWVRLQVRERPAEVAVPVSLIGERRWLLRKGDEWQTEWVVGSQLPLERWFGGQPGVVEARLWLRAPQGRRVTLGFPCNAAFQLWLNGIELLNAHQPNLLVRPGQQGPATHYVQAVLRQGWNEVNVRLERHEEPVEAYLILTDPSDLHRGVTEVLMTQAP
ncbi:MAG TPA: ADP-ribosylglycohydrolase family protein [Armatimonadetes bacterium]|nr:ADP-ribosylglycohydrolase family protein [Armatimonadota bacterium]